jgi:hypothetical protein
MNEERTGKCLRQVEHIRGLLWYICSIAVNQIIVATVKRSKWWLQLNQEEHLRKLHNIEMTKAPSMYTVIPWGAPLRNIPLSNLSIIWLGRRRTWNLKTFWASILRVILAVPALVVTPVALFVGGYVGEKWIFSS